MTARLVRSRQTAPSVAVIECGELWVAPGGVVGSAWLLAARHAQVAGSRLSAALR
jgi:hypothetical protein